MAVKRWLRGRGYDVRALDVDDLDLYRRIYGEDATRERRFYNVGAGTFRHPAWTNVDHESAWYGGTQINLEWDLLALGPFPVPDHSAEIVYTSHTIEHVTDEAVANLFRETRRVLKPGGVVRVTAPNIDLDFRAYREGDREHFRHYIDRYSLPDHWRTLFTQSLAQASLPQLFLIRFATNASTLHVDGAASRLSDADVDRMFRNEPYEKALDACVARCSLDVQRRFPGNHINWWNPNKVKRFLRDAGFDTVYVSAYGQSRSPVLRNTDYFDNTHPKLSLYVEAKA